MKTQEVIEVFLNTRRAAAATDNTIATYLTILNEYANFVPTWPPEPQSLAEYLLSKKATCNKVTLHSLYLTIRAFLNWCQKQNLIKVWAVMTKADTKRTN